MIVIHLSRKQVESAQWMMGCPLFQNNETAEELAFSWDVSLDVAKIVVANVPKVKIEDHSLKLPHDRHIIKYLIGYAEQLVSTSGNEYLDELLGKNVEHREAVLKANAAVQSADALMGKLKEALKTADVECWYDFRSRNWIIHQIDAEGNQIGDAQFAYHKKTAVEIQKSLQAGIDVALSAEHDDRHA